MSVSSKHASMLKQSLKTQTANERPLKRRRKAAPPAEVVTISSESTSDSDLEDVDLEGSKTPKPEAAAESQSDDSDDFDDLEDVDIESVFGEVQSGPAETLTFKIDGDKKDEKSKKSVKRTYKPISKEERTRRLNVHKLMVFSMLCHGAIRNKWCSNAPLQQSLSKVVPEEVKKLLDQDDEDVLDYVKSKRFVDALRKLSSVYSRKFRCSTPGLERHDWQCSGTQKKAETLDTFSRAVKSFRGSRDVGAQGFVAILRSIGVDARLVFSIQVPDFRSLKPVSSPEEPVVVEDEPETENSEFAPVFIPDSRQALLKSARKPAAKESSRKPASKFPVFWIEVWNKYSKKMITIDPIVFNIVEVMPMRRKCRFDAPSAEATHQTWYVIAYNPDGSLRDVTRRYTQFFNAKTAKKRMSSHSDEDEHWYQRILRAVGKQRRITNADAMEMKELYDRHICEGTPNNMADFKNHPVYALESQLRQDEVIYPNNETSKCGTFRSANKKNVIPIYKRSHVCRLRTPKAWHMLGRVLKVGAQPLKVRQINVNSMTEQDEEEDGEIRMYAEFQTDLLIPPPIENGKIIKNAYGNVEIFKPSMIPENGYLAEISKSVTLKILEQAARTLNIDYARAIVAFDFGGGSKNNKRSVTAREGGILVAREFKDALLAVVDGFLQLEEDKQRESVLMNALRSWKFFLAKLRIVKRLDAQHGKIAQQPSDAGELSESADEGYYSVGSDGDGSENEQYVPQKSRSRRINQETSGGFLLQDAIQDQLQDNSEEADEGGFFSTTHNGESVESDSAPYAAREIDTPGDDTGGGFFAGASEGHVPEQAEDSGLTAAHKGERQKSTDSNGFSAQAMQSEEQQLGIEYSDSDGLNG